MARKRVVVTGMGAVTPYGEGVPLLMAKLCAGECAISKEDLSCVAGLDCHVAGRVRGVNGKTISRTYRRSMSPMSIWSCLAAREALLQADIPVNREDAPRMGVAIGSTLGSPMALEDFFREYISTGAVDEVRSTAFLKTMSHTVASNTSLFCGCTGRMLAPSAACASGLVAIGLACEAVAQGKEDIMLCGGADECHALTAATFDRMGAATHASDPLGASRPFDSARSGLAVSEGAGVLVIESLDSAQARHAKPLAELSGYASTSSPASMAHPDPERMEACMCEALQDAGFAPSEIGCVCAHATSTLQGDEAEGLAIERLFGPMNVPVVALKGHLGHTMGASGALECIACVEMLRHGTLIPTFGLTKPDPACGRLDHVRSPRNISGDSILKNAFAMGGVFASLAISPAH